MLSKNRVVIAAAGSRKTTCLVEDALSDPGKKILIVTYTLENLKQIRKYIVDRAGIVPENITVQSWFSFLLQDCVRPYQNYFYSKRRIENISFIKGRSASYASKANIERYYLVDGDKVYSDKISEFVCICNEKSGGCVIKRLENIYNTIFVDEVQDMAGYDFDFFGNFIPVSNYDDYGGR